jgi:hypothetical protein
MSLETFTFITSLVNTNPVGAVDPKSQGDDHLRGIKTVLLNSWPNINAAVSATPAQLNVLTGTTNDRVVRVTGAALNLGQLTAGMFPNAVVPDAALSTNVPLINVNNIFLQNVNGNNIQTIQNQSTGASAIAGLNLTNSADTLFMRILGTGFSGTHMSGQAAGEAAMLATTSALQLGFGTNSICRFNIDGSGNFDFRGGTVTTNCASAQEVGTSGPVFRAVSASTNTAATDMGRGIVFTGGSGQTFTLDADPPTNSVVVLVNESGNSWQIAASVTLIFNGTTGTRTLPDKCMAVAVHRQGSGTWQIAGQLA